MIERSPGPFRRASSARLRCGISRPGGSSTISHCLRRRSKSRSIPRARACSRRRSASSCCGTPRAVRSSPASGRKPNSCCRRCFPADGGYVAIAERVDGGSPLYSVLLSADASLVTTIEGAAETQGWELGPGGRYLALQGPETTVNPRRRDAPRRRARTSRTRTRRRPAPARERRDDALDRRSRRRRSTAWPLAASAERGRPLGRTAAAASVSASADARRLAFARVDGCDRRARRRGRRGASSPAVAALGARDGHAAFGERHGARDSKRRRAQVVATGRRRPWRRERSPSARCPRRWRSTARATSSPSGSASGQLQLGPVAAAAEARDSLAFFGHRGRHHPRGGTERRPRFGRDEAVTMASFASGISLPARRRAAVAKALCGRTGDDSRVEQ